MNPAAVRCILGTGYVNKMKKQRKSTHYRLKSENPKGVVAKSRHNGIFHFQGKITRYSWALLPWTVIIAISVLLGLVVAVLSLFPRVSVDISVDSDKPASILFRVSNTNFVPLHEVSYGMYTCYLQYNGTGAPKGNGVCDWTLAERAFSSPVLIAWQWIMPDSQESARLEDMVIIPSAQISFANLIIDITYMPWYLPCRFEHRFGFRTERGTDGVLYWRPYQPPISGSIRPWCGWATSWLPWA